MALMRIQNDLAIPMRVWDKIPADRKAAAVQTIRDLKALAVRINEGQPNEEMTVKATYHIYHHDSANVPCETEREI